MRQAPHLTRILALVAITSAQQPGRRERDVCLALLPSSGGTQRRLSCDLSPPGELTDAIESPTSSPDGSFVFVGFTSRINALMPDSGAISIGPLADPAARTPLRPLPHAVPGEQLHSGASQLHWLGPRRVVYLAERVDYGHTCNIPSICADWGEGGWRSEPIPAWDLPCGTAEGCCTWWIFRREPTWRSMPLGWSAGRRSHRRGRPSWPSLSSKHR
jgi:hypothetical protein